MNQFAKGSFDGDVSIYPIRMKCENAYRTLRNEVLAIQCLKELGHFQRGEPCDEQYGLELLRRATMESDPEAWEWVQHCFRDLAYGWLHRHPSRANALKLDSDENYIALAFGRFWMATTLNKKIEFKTLAAAMRYLHASLNGAILDTLRTYARPKEVSLLDTEESAEPFEEDKYANLEVWEILHSLLPNPREQRLVSLLYYSGLKPREIIRLCPQEWNDVNEIYCLRRKILERLTRRADQLGWKLSLNIDSNKDGREDGKKNKRRRRE